MYGYLSILCSLVRGSKVAIFSKEGANPHFFCESCGKEVARSAKNCPACGSAFASVLCPACDFSGEEGLFKGGCPACGYSSKVSQESDQIPLDFPVKRKPSGALPIWVYIFTASVFTAILAALFFTAFR